MAAPSLRAPCCQHPPFADRRSPAPFLPAHRKPALSRLSCERRLPAHELHVPLLSSRNHLSAGHVRSLAWTHEQRSGVVKLGPPGYSASRRVCGSAAVGAVASRRLPCEVERRDTDRLSPA